MSSITPIQIPASALPASGGTIETLALWALMALREANGKKGVVEESGGQSLDLFAYQTIQVPDGSTRVLFRANFKVDTAYITSSTQQFWEFAQEATSGDPPDNYVV